MTQFGRMWWVPLLQWLNIGSGLGVGAWSFGPVQSDASQDTNRVPQPSDVGSTANHTSKYLQSTQCFVQDFIAYQYSPGS